MRLWVSGKMNEEVLDAEKKVAQVMTYSPTHPLLTTHSLTHY